MQIMAIVFIQKVEAVSTEDIYTTSNYYTGAFEVAVKRLHHIIHSHPQALLCSGGGVDSRDMQPPMRNFSWHYWIERSDSRRGRPNVIRSHPDR